MNTFFNDIKYSLRQFRMYPLSNGIIVLTIALLIGGLSVIYASIRKERDQREPFPEPERLVKLWRIGARGIFLTFPPVLFHEYRERLESSQTLGAIDLRAKRSMILTGESEPKSYTVRSVTVGVLQLAGVGPVRGRLFDEEDENKTSDGIVIISEQMWQERYGKDPNTIGRDLVLDDVPYTVIGVLPASMRTTRLGYEVDIWRLTRIEQAQNASVLLFGRLKPGIPLRQAQAEIAMLAPRIEEQHTPSERESRAHPEGFKTARVVPIGMAFRSTSGNRVRILLLTLKTVVLGCLVGIVCFNITNLLLAQYSTRSREISIRLSLGACRFRIVRQLLTETILLSLLGGVLGVWVSFWMISLLQTQHIASTFDGQLFLLALVASLILGTLVGLVPALRSSKRDLAESLKDGGTSVGGRKRHRIRNVLVSSEVAMACVLCVVFGLTARGFLGFSRDNLGFQPDRLLSIEVQLRSDKYRGQRDQIAYIERGLRALSEIPGIESASVVLRSVIGPRSSQDFIYPGRTGDEGEGVSIRTSRVGPGYTEVFGMSLVKGRGFPKTGLPVRGEVLVNETLAAKYFPNTDPIGQEIRSGLDWDNRLTIVGVLRDRHLLMSHGSVKPEIFYDYRGNFSKGGFVFIAQTRGDAKAMAASARATIARLDTDQPVGQPQTMSELFDQLMAPAKPLMMLLGSLAGVGLIITLIGVYGIVSFSVVERTRELGIRMALGASRTEVLQLILWQGMRLMFFGVPFGMLIGALVFSRIPRENIRYGVIFQWDIATYAGVLLLIGLVGLCSSLLAAQRAAKINPMEALRYE